MQKFWPLCVFFLKKLGLSLLNIVAFFVGIVLWALTIYPFNFPYLLQLPFEETNAVTASVFAVLFVCIVTVAVRTKWCFETDLFFAKEGEKAPPLIWRIVSSQEFIADVIVFAAMVLGLFTWIAATSDAPWYRAVPTVALIVVGGTIVFAALDCLLYVIARKKADKRLRKREEK